jgi:hypothetical protein
MTDDRTPLRDLLHGLSADAELARDKSQEEPTRRLRDRADGRADAYKDAERRLRQALADVEDDDEPDGWGELDEETRDALRDTFKGLVRLATLRPDESDGEDEEHRLANAEPVTQPRGDRDDEEGERWTSEPQPTRSAWDRDEDDA